MTGIQVRRRRTRRETVNVHDLNKAIERIRQYKAAGLTEMIDKFRTRNSISRSTLNSWLDDPQRAATASKAPYLLKALHELPPVAKQKQHHAYRLLLKELGIGDGHANELVHIHGLYTFRHNLKDNSIAVGDTILLDSQKTPEVASFQFRYESNAKYRICDGLIVQRNQKLHLIGLSEQNMFFGNLNAVRVPSSEIMYGVCSFEEIYANRIFYNRIAVYSKKYTTNHREEEHIRDYLKMPLI